MQASCRSGHVHLTLEVRLDGASKALSGDKATATVIVTASTLCPALPCPHAARPATDSAAPSGFGEPVRFPRLPPDQPVHHACPRPASPTPTAHPRRRCAQVRKSVPTRPSSSPIVALTFVLSGGLGWPWSSWQPTSSHVLEVSVDPPGCRRHEQP